MNEDILRVYLEHKGISPNSINLHCHNAARAESVLKENYDRIVMNDDDAYYALIELAKYEYSVMHNSHQPLQTTLRKYYAAVNGKEFPQMKDYRPAR